MKYIVAIILFFALFLGVFLMFQKNEIEYNNNVEISPTNLNRTENEPINLLFVGDIMLGRNVEVLMSQNGEQYPFEKIESTFQNYDSVIANLEGPIPVNHVQTRSGEFSFSFKDFVAQLLKKNNINFVTLANNHTSDKGEDDFENTKKVLADVGVQSFGHSRQIGDVSVLKTTIKNQDFVFIGFNTTFGNFDSKLALDLVAKEVLKTNGMVIVFMHWGNEYELSSNKIQQDLAHELIDVGADLIIGHHPHVVQEIEEYKGKMIFYSLGNFIFDQYFSQDTQEELIIGLQIENDEMKFILIPIKSVKSQPEFMDENSKMTFLNKLSQRSSSSLSEKIKSGIIIK